jgi:hypothetical protein
LRVNYNPKSETATAKFFAPNGYFSFTDVADITNNN